MSTSRHGSRPAHRSCPTAGAGWLWLPLLLAISACSSEDGAGAKLAATHGAMSVQSPPSAAVMGVPAAGSGGLNPWVLGGQTGALSSVCGLTPAAEAGTAVPGGQTGIVLYADGCAMDLLEGLELLDPSGMPVAFKVERLPGGATLLRPLSPLMPGTYMVRGPGLEPTDVMVAEAPPAPPAQLGAIRQTGFGCRSDFQLTLTEDAIPYVPQLKLDIQIDGGLATTWFDYGALEVDGRVALVSLPPCFAGCLVEGEHDLVIAGTLAGQNDELEPLTTTFVVGCTASDDDASSSPSSSPRSGSGSGCAMSGSRAGHCDAWPWALVALLLFTPWIRRARKPPPD